jgi:hypothetical protein
VFEKAKADDIVKEKLGSETLGLKLKELWPAETPHLAIADLSDWFSAHPYLPKLKDRVVLDLAIRELVAKFDAPFAYADRFDGVHGIYEGLNYERTAPELLASQGLLACIMHRHSNFGSICGVDGHFRSSLGAAGQLRRAAEVCEEMFAG